jgi:hypothetical protein
MYELGYAIAAGKSVVIISGPNAERFPFDIQHRGILSYAVGSISDFTELGQKLTAKLNAILDLQEKTSTIAEASPVKESFGLQPHEVTALALLLANCDSPEDNVSASIFKQVMRKAGFSDVGTRVAIARLVKLGYVSSALRGSNYDEHWTVYGITERGEDWLVENQTKLELRVRQRANVTSNDNKIEDEDIPF